jgi:hypothetical protein
VDEILAECSFRVRMGGMPDKVFASSGWSTVETSMLVVIATSGERGMADFRFLSSLERHARHSSQMCPVLVQYPHLGHHPNIHPSPFDSSNPLGGMQSPFGGSISVPTMPGEHRNVVRGTTVAGMVKFLSFEMVDNVIKVKGGVTVDESLLKWIIIVRECMEENVDKYGVRNFVF